MTDGLPERIPCNNTQAVTSPDRIRSDRHAHQQGIRGPDFSQQTFRRWISQDFDVCFRLQACQSVGVEGAWVMTTLGRMGDLLVKKFLDPVKTSRKV